MNGSDEARLKRVLELSRLQKLYLKDGRLEEVIKCQMEREAILSETSVPETGDVSLKALAAAIIESDRGLSEDMEIIMDGLGSKLIRIRKGTTAMRAYAG